MDVAIGSDQRRDLDAVAADVADEVGEDRETGHHMQSILRARRARRRDHRNQDKPEKPSHCRLRLQMTAGNIWRTSPPTLPKKAKADKARRRPG